VRPIGQREVENFGVKTEVNVIPPSCLRRMSTLCTETHIAQKFLEDDVVSVYRFSRLIVQSTHAVARVFVVGVPTRVRASMAIEVAPANLNL
jgi:hypothetical protein